MAVVKQGKGPWGRCFLAVTPVPEVMELELDQAAQDLTLIFIHFWEEGSGVVLGGR